MPAPRYVLALDQGTTSSRAILFDAHGTPVSSAQQEFRQIYPQPGWVEHDPKEILQTQRAVAREAMRLSAVAPGDVLAIGLSNQRQEKISGPEGENSHRKGRYQGAVCHCHADAVDGPG